MKTLLRNAREQKGLKVREVAEKLQIDQALISKFESGQRNPTRKQVLQLAELLDINREQILTIWLKEKILRELEGEEFAVHALKAAEAELHPQTPKADPLQKLLDEMDALKQKFENLRGS
ncbi:helix-turn-helix domain-containing protein [Flavobacterium sp.]|uniref:helix-turn-helix domain-containing protein n=1 Tax=Flavobacterium sp. TaxID=239 RepID=UPI0039E72A3D